MALPCGSGRRWWRAVKMALGLCLCFLIPMAAAGIRNTNSIFGDQKLKLEVQQQLKLLNKPAHKSIKSSDGDIIDCIHINNQPAFDHPLFKNHTIQMRPSFHPDGRLFDESKVSSKSKSINQLWHLNGRCPEGTIPVRRTKEDDLLRASSVKSYGRKKHLTIPKPSSAQPDLINQGGHQHAIVYVEGDKYYGAKATINVWKPQIQEPNEFSLSQIWILGGSFGEDLNSIEAGWQVSPDLYGDSNSRLFTYWTSDAYQATGCYNLLCSGFIQINNQIAMGASIYPVSGYGGSQYDISILVWKDPKEGNWWMQFGNEHVLGYWPAFLFSYLSDSASMVEWGGEVVNSQPDGQHTSTQMGSGHFSGEGFGSTPQHKWAVGTHTHSTVTMKPIIPLALSLLLNFLVLCAAADHESSSSTSTTILFATLGGRSANAFDVFALPTWDPPSITAEIRITDGRSLNFNGHFPSSSLFSLLTNQSLIQTRPEPIPTEIIYVTERNGTWNIYYDAVFRNTPRSTRFRSALEEEEEEDNLVRFQLPLLGSMQSNNQISMKDKPSLSGDYLVYVSTHEDTGEPRTSWAAVYSTELRTGLTRRLTPLGIADFSPAVSPSGVWTAVASYGEKGWNGDVEELSTDIYVFLTRDGTQRVKVVEHGGWPCWVDEFTLYFHRRGSDNWWSIYRAILPSEGLVSTESVVVERVTPPGLHAFTPAASPGNKNFIAVATRRSTSKFRHIELFDLAKNEFKELTRLVSPETHHFNPFFSSDSNRVGYHRCRGESNGRKNTQLLLENLQSPVADVSLFRMDGSFPSFSPAGDRIAYVEFPGVYVVNRDGSNRRQVYPDSAFSTVWDQVRKGVIYTSTGPTFAEPTTEVDVISINVDDDDDLNGQPKFKKLTTNGENNAFPFPSPDGKWVVFRSGRSGYKNLYIMDAVDGERAGLQRLTEGPWSDTMCSWSPDGDWIAFASDRENPGSGSFELYLIHPNRTGLRKLFQSGSGGRANHPTFSPDGKSVVFTSDYAGISAEPISNPHHYQPYGEIFTMKLDGSDLKRLTHNSFEDGTPTWGHRYIKPLDVEWLKGGPRCSFEDCHWLNQTPNQNHGDVSAKPQCRA